MMGITSRKLCIHFEETGHTTDYYDKDGAKFKSNRY